jgi:hypothetical protein
VKAAGFGGAVLVTALAVGCNSINSEEDAMKDLVSTTTRMADILERQGVNNATREELEALDQKAAKLKRQMASWPRPKRHEMMSKYGGELEAAERRIDKARFGTFKEP